MSEAPTDLATKYLDAVLSGDRRRALDLIVHEGLGRGLAVPDLQLQVIQVAQYEVGRLWQENKLSVAQEHLATAVSQLVLSHLYQHLPRMERNGKRVLVACVEGEQHEMGVRILADFLEMSGFEAQLLGANVPTDSLVARAAQSRPDLIALSASLSFHIPALRAAVARLREALGASLPILIGGRAVLWAPGIEEQLGVPPAAKDAREMVAAARAILGVAQ